MGQIESMVVKKPDAIVFTPVDLKAVVRGMEKIDAAKLPVRKHH